MRIHEELHDVNLQNMTERSNSPILNMSNSNSQDIFPMTIQHFALQGRHSPGVPPGTAPEVALGLLGVNEGFDEGVDEGIAGGVHEGVMKG